MTPRPPPIKELEILMTKGDPWVRVPWPNNDHTEHDKGDGEDDCNEGDASDEESCQELTMR